MSVCKYWYSLIKTPYFISTHLNHQLALSNSNEGPTYLLYYDIDSDINSDNPQNFVVYCDNDNNFDRHLEFVFPGEPGMDIIVGFCNGVVCFAKSISGVVVLWNPSLRKSLKLHVPYPMFKGFGFDPSSNDYKIVCWGGTHLGALIGAVYVYSLNAGTWHRVNTSFSLDEECFIYRREVHVNGVIHWLVYRSDGEEVPVYILTFSLMDETFGEIPLPGETVLTDLDQCGSCDLLTFPSNGTEQVAYFHVNGDCSKLWMLEVDGVMKSWKLVFSINIVYNIMNLENFRKNGEMVVRLKTGGMASLDRRGMSLSHISGRSLHYMGSLVESLFLPGRGWTP